MWFAHWPRTRSEASAAFANGNRDRFDHAELHVIPNGQCCRRITFDAITNIKIVNTTERTTKTHFMVGG